MIANCQIAKRASCGGALLLAVLLAVICTSAVAEPLSEQEERGKQIYVQGASMSGAPITAVVARGSPPIPASILPCVGCHGNDGKGRPEGGVVPPDITWKTLTASYGHEHTYDRSHPAFDEKSLMTAFLEGLDPAGNDLDVAMPRYQMNKEDAVDLVAYLQRIETDFDPGLSTGTIRIGTLLPLEGDLQGLGESMKNVLDGYFSDVNSAGGIHGRQLELVVGEYDTDVLHSRWQARDLLERQSVFATVSGYAAGIEQPLAALAEELGVPMIGPYTQLPQSGNGLDRHSFYLLGGIVQQAAVLTRQRLADGRPADRKMAIIYPQSAAYQAAIDAVQRELADRSAHEAFVLSYSPPFFDAVDVAQILSEKQINTVMFFGQGGDLKRLSDEAKTQDWLPELLLPGVFAGKTMFEITPPFRLFLGYSSLPSDHTPQGVQNFEALHNGHEFGYQNSTAQISSYVATMVLVEGLKRAGKDLSREKLIAALEGLADFQPGLMPPISYNRRRRIGALGGYVMELDLEQKKFGAASNWVSLQL